MIMKKAVVFLLSLLQFFNFNVFSQKNTNAISVYAFKTDNPISNEFKKEFEIFYTINPKANYVFLTFMANNCNDVRYGCPIIYGDESYITSQESIKGVLYYQD